MPVCFGFFIPIAILLTNVINSTTVNNIFENLLVLKNTLFVSFVGSFLVIIVGTTCAAVAKLSGDKNLQNLSKLSATGYAFPGTILAIGIIIFVGYIDQLIGIVTMGTKLSNFYISGTLSVLIFAYLTRFLAVGYGSALSGLDKTSPNLVWASRTLGVSFLGTITSITIPLIRPSIIAGGVLVFVDIMKELPMTLLLRPFNFDTLATQTYQFAHDELMNEASLPALMIISAGLIPVFFLNKILRNHY